MCDAPLGQSDDPRTSLWGCLLSSRFRHVAGAPARRFCHAPYSVRLERQDDVLYHRAMRVKVGTVDQYLVELPAERRDALETVRAVIGKNRPPTEVGGKQEAPAGTPRAQPTSSGLTMHYVCDACVEVIETAIDALVSVAPGGHRGAV